MPTLVIVLLCSTRRRPPDYVGSSSVLLCVTVRESVCLCGYVQICFATFEAAAQWLIFNTVHRDTVTQNNICMCLCMCAYVRVLGEVGDLWVGVQERSAQTIYSYRVRSKSRAILDSLILIQLCSILQCDFRYTFNSNDDSFRCPHS